MIALVSPTCLYRVPIVSAREADEGCSLPMLSRQVCTARVSHDVQLVVMGCPPVLLCTGVQPACLSINHAVLRAAVQPATQAILQSKAADVCIILAYRL